MGDNDLFDVPFCRVEKPKISFSELAIQKDRVKEDFQIITKPGQLIFNQTKDRPKYNNKLIKQLQAVGVNVNEKTGQVESDSSASHSDYFSEQDSNVNETLVNLVDETLDAISEKKMDNDDDLSSWDPMKEAYEQRHFNSYQEPGYDAPFTEKHNPVRGTKISPAKGSEDEVTLFVSNIPMALSEDALKHMFSTCGRCRRVKKCRPKISNSDTTFGFIAYSSVREAEEAITKFDRFQFGKGVELRVRLSHGKERNFGFVPNNINIKLGSSNSSENEESSSKLNEVKEPETIPKETQQNLLFPNMFSNGVMKENVKQEVNRGPRLYVQGISVKISSDILEKIIGEIVPCREGLVVPQKSPNQFTTFGFVTVGNIEDAEKVIKHYEDFGGRMKISYCEQSAKEYGKDSKTDEDRFYLKLYEESARFDDDFISGSNKPEIQEEASPSSKCTIVSDMPSITTEKNSNVTVNNIVPSRKEELFSVEKEDELTNSNFQNLRGLEVLENALSGSSKSTNPTSVETDLKESEKEQQVISGSPELESPEDPLLEDLSFTESLPNISKHNYVPINIPKRNPVSSTISSKPDNQEMSNQSSATQLTSSVTKSSEENPALPTKSISSESLISTTSDPNESVVIKASATTTTHDKPTVGLKEDISPSPIPIKEQTFIPDDPICNGIFTFVFSSLPSNINPLEFVISKLALETLYSDSYKILVTHVESPHLIYGKLTDHTLNHKTMIKKLATELSNFRDNSFPFSFKAGVLALVRTQDGWKRGLITKIEEILITAFLFDDGTEIVCQKNKVYPFPKNLKQYPAQAIPLKLFNVRPFNDEGQWSSSTIDFLKKILLMKTVVVNPEFKDRTVFDVKMIYENEQLDRILEEKKLAKRFYSDLPQICKNWFPGYKDTLYGLQFNQKLDTEIPTAGEFEGYITFAPGPKLFYCRLLDSSKDMKVDEIENEMKLEFQDKKGIPENDIVEGQLCSFRKSDNQWHRGFVLKLSYDYVSIFLIDYGSKHKVEKSCVYPLLDAHQSLPGQAITAQLQYVTPHHYSGYTSDAIKRFNELVRERKLTFQVINKHEKMHRVLVIDQETGMDVGRTLVREGHARFIFDKSSTYSESQKDANISKHYYTNKEVKNEEKTSILPHNQKDETHKTKPPKSPPRGILQNDQSQTNTTNKSPLGRGYIMGRGLALLKEHGLMP